MYAIATAGASPVCRFFSTLFDPKSHFYTPFPTECASLKTSGGWQFKARVTMCSSLPSPASMARVPLASAVYRLYNNGQGGAPNHRYDRDQCAGSDDAAGWIIEGNGQARLHVCAAVVIDRPRRLGRTSFGLARRRATPQFPPTFPPRTATARACRIAVQGRRRGSMLMPCRRHTVACVEAPRRARRGAYRARAQERARRVVASRLTRWNRPAWMEAREEGARKPRCPAPVARARDAVPVRGAKLRLAGQQMNSPHFASISGKRLMRPMVSLRLRRLHRHAPGPRRFARNARAPRQIRRSGRRSAALVRSSSVHAQGSRSRFEFACRRRVPPKPRHVTHGVRVTGRINGNAVLGGYGPAR
jgi:hypothetical protein